MTDLTNYICGHLSMTDSFLGPNFYAFPIFIKYGHLMIQTFTLYSNRIPWEMVSFSKCPREWGWWGGGGRGFYIKVIGMLVGKFKLNPKGDQCGCG